MSRAPADGRPGQTVRLPAQAGSSLDDAFRREVRTRLPRLLAAADLLADTDPAIAGRAVAQLRSDVHTLASSSVIVGAHAAARVGRECEWLLLAYDDGALPPEIAAKAAALARGVGRALGRWTRG